MDPTRHSESSAIAAEPMRNLLLDGFAAQQAGDLDGAESLYRRALEARPDDADARYLLGFLHHQRGEEDQALSLILEAVAQRPEEALFLKGLGDVFRNTGHQDRARECYARAVTLDRLFVDPLVALGELAASEMNLKDAVDWFRRAINVDSTSVQAYIGLGCAFRELNNLDGAERCLKIAVELKPTSPEAIAALGEIAMKRRQFSEAESLFRKSLDLRPLSPLIMNNLGSALKEQGRIAESIPWYLEAADRAPNEPSVAFNLGCAHGVLGETGEAIRWYNRATDLKPDYAEAHANKSLLLLTSGDFEHGWEEYEWRFKIKDDRQKIDRRVFPAPLWDGSPFPGKTLLVRSEQGAGDMIQFSRYLPLAKALGGRVIFETGKKLCRLLQYVEGADQIVTISETPRTNFDFWIPLLSLPKYFTRSITDIPSSQSYLRAEPELVASTAELIDRDSFTVGLCWQGNREYVGDGNRSMPFNDFAAVFAVPGVRFYSLQKGFGSEQLDESPHAASVEDIAARLDAGADRFVESAAVIMHLDLVISVDTAIAHLAGALGRPVWLLLSPNAEWRWFRNTEDSPWYPSMRLFRRRPSETWSALVERVSHQLLEVINSGHQLHPSSR